MVGAGVEPLAGQRGDDGGQHGQRIVGLVGIGDMALRASDGDLAGERATAADLDAVTQGLGRTGFADNGEIEGVAVLGHPGHQLLGAVDGVGFLVIGDGELDGAGFGRCGGAGGDEGGNP